MSSSHGKCNGLFKKFIFSYKKEERCLYVCALEEKTQQILDVTSPKMIKHNAYLLSNFLEERTVLSETVYSQIFYLMSFYLVKLHFKKTRRK